MSKVTLGRPSNGQYLMSHHSKMAIRLTVVSMTDKGQVGRVVNAMVELVY